MTLENSPELCADKEYYAAAIILVECICMAGHHCELPDTADHHRASTPSNTLWQDASAAVVSFSHLPGARTGRTPTCR